MRDDVEAAHREAARVLGQMALALARGRINPAVLRTWAEALERAARYLRDAGE